MNRSDAVRPAEYRWTSATAPHTYAYLWPKIDAILESLSPRKSPAGQNSNNRGFFDRGCGNGACMRHSLERGFCPLGVDPSTSGIEAARQAAPALNVKVGSDYDSLAETYWTFPIVVSLEVVEHLYFPKQFARNVFELLEPGGTAVICTPFHGYWKNLSMALTGNLDKHFTVLLDHGHIKFWSPETLTILLREAGFQKVSFDYAGRFYPFSKSMIAIAEKPA